MLKLLPTSASPTRRYQFPRGWVCSRTSVPQSRWSWVPCCTFGSLVARSCTGLTTIVQYITTLIYESINILLWLLMLHSLWYMISFDTQIFNFKCVVWLVIFVINMKELTAKFPCIPNWILRIFRFIYFCNCLTLVFLGRGLILSSAFKNRIPLDNLWWPHSEFIKAA